MKYLLILVLMLGLVGCETTMGSKRSNGSNTEHTTVKWKNVVVHGNVNVGGASQSSKGASQEGLGRVDAKAQVDDSLNGNKVTPDALKPTGTLTDSFRTIPSKTNVPPVE